MEEQFKFMEEQSKFMEEQSKLMEEQFKFMEEVHILTWITSKFWGVQCAKELVKWRTGEL